MSFLDGEYTEMRPDDDIRAEVLDRVSKVSKFAFTLVPMGKRWFIYIAQDWDEIEEAKGEVTGKVKLSLVFNGPQNGEADLIVLKCDGMLSVLGNLAKLINDQKQLKWDDANKVWRW